MLIAIFQRYILKAIHNQIMEHIQAEKVDSNISKIHFKSYSQHSHKLITFTGVDSNISKIHFKSYSQQTFVFCMYYYVDSNISKIHFKSYSQHRDKSKELYPC